MEVVTDNVKMRRPRYLVHLKMLSWPWPVWNYDGWQGNRILRKVEHVLK